MDLDKVEEIAKKIQGQLFKNGHGMSTGLIKTSFRGAGLTFKEHQVYTYGDDVKFIDWKILARLGQTYIRTFEEERNIEIVTLIDATPTMNYGHKGVSKFQAALEICCLLLLTCKKSGDTVQPVVVSDSVHVLKPTSGKEGMVQLLGYLMSKGFLDDQGRVKLDRPLKFNQDKKRLGIQLMSLFKRHSEVVLLSDFKNFLPDALLEKVLFKKNVHAFQILSPLDEMKKIPYSILALNDFGGTRKKVTSFSLASKNNNDSKRELIAGRNVKKIMTDRPYLDDFIRSLK